MTSVDQIRISLKPALVYETQKTQIFTTIPTSLTSSEDCLYYTLPHPHYYPYPQYTHRNVNSKPSQLQIPNSKENSSLPSNSNIQKEISVQHHVNEIIKPKTMEDTHKLQENLDEIQGNIDQIDERSSLLHEETKKEKKTFKIPLFSAKPPKNYAPYDEL